MRNFLSAGLSDGMFDGVPKTKYWIQREDSEVKDLASAGNLISSIGCRALVNSLKKRGVNLISEKTFIKLESSDNLYVVTVSEGDHVISLSDYRLEDDLPEEATIKVVKYSFVPRYQ